MLYFELFNKKLLVISIFFLNIQLYKDITIAIGNAINNKKPLTNNGVIKIKENKKSPIENVFILDISINVINIHIIAQPIAFPPTII